jgi:uncharacterized protein (DUF427 family)
MGHIRVKPGPGQESVWDYPRPPRLERVEKQVRIELAGKLIVDAPWAWRVLETSHPPTYYIDPQFIRMEFLREVGSGSHCEWKGEARYYSVAVGEQAVKKVAWCYPNPTPVFQTMKNCIAFYAGPMDVCTVDGEAVTPQPGGFYGGWITSDITGPFKGIPGSWGW